MKKRMMVGDSFVGCLCTLLAMTVAVSTCFALTSGSDFLKLGLGAKQVASGEIDLPTDETQATSLWWNPALLANSYQQNLSLTGTKFLQNLNYGAFSYSYPLTQGAIGFGMEYLDYGKFEGYDAWAGQTEVSPSYDMAALLGYGLPIKKTFPYERTVMLVGGAVRIIQQKLDQYSATGFSLDGGVLWVAPVDNLLVFLALKNLGTKMTFVKEGSPLPLTLNSGVFYTIPSINTTLGLNIASFPFEKEFSLGGGFEATILGILSLRAGYRNTISGLGSSTKYLSNGLRVGAGIKAGTFGIDYAYVPWGDFGSSHLVSVSFSFGGVPGGITQLNHYLQAHLSDGKKYFYRKDYIRARKEFQSVLDFYPEHSVAKEYLALIKQDLDRMQLRRKKIEERYIASSKRALARGDILSASKYLAFAEELNPEGLEVKEIQKQLAQKKEEFARQTLVARQQKEIAGLWSSGIKYFKSSDFVEAKVEFGKILDIDPEHAGAKEYVRKINSIFAEVTSSQVSDFYAKGLACYEQKDYHKAILYWEAVLSAQPEREDARSYLEKARAELVQLEAQKEGEKKERLEREKENELRKKKKYADSLVKKGSYLNALGHYRDVLEKSQELGLEELSKETQSEMDKINEKLADYYFSRGYTFYQQNKIEEAIREFEQTLNFDPEYEGASERLETLRQNLREAKKKQADEYYQKGLKSYNEGNLEQATDYWKKAVELCPEHEEAKRALERVQSYKR